MLRTTLAAVFGTVVAGSLALGGAATADDKKPAAPGAGHAGHFLDCAKACDDCARVCTACGAHCAKLAIDGQKMHAETMKTCQDCAAICSAAGCIMAKGGPFSDLICTACADACKRCGDACEKHAGHTNDAMMKQCAEECRKCEKACREMLKHAQANSAPK